MTTLAEQVQELKALRAKKAELDKGVLVQQGLVNANEIYQKLIHLKLDRDQLEEQISTVSTSIRESAVEVYRTTQNKNPLPGLVIKVFKKLRYDAKVAEEWARIHAPAVFKFDVKSFERVAVDLGAPVTVDEVPQAQIASELE